MSRMGDFPIKDATSLLSSFFDEDQLRHGKKYVSFFTNWKYLVGEKLAAHSRIVDIERSVLIVEAEHPGWIQLLQMNQAEILRNVASKFPELELRSIVFRLAGAITTFPVKGKTPDTVVDSPVSTDVPLSDEPKKRVWNIADIHDTDLQAELEKLKKAMDERASGKKD